MAETPECAYRAARSVAVGARHVLTVLYTRARRDVVVAYLEDLGPAPFVWPGKEWIEDMSGCSRSQVYEHLKALEQLGAAIPGQQKIDGKVRKGWVLPLRDGVQPVPLDSSEGRQLHDSEAGPPGGVEHARAEVKPEVVRPAGQTDPEDVRPAGNPADRKSGPPDKTVRPAGSENPAGRTNSSGPPDQNRKGTGERTGRGTDVDDVTNSTERRASPADRTPRAVARRPYPDAPDGQPVGGASAARALLVELAHLHRPADAGRCFTPSNRRHLELAELLLAVSPGPGDDAGAVANERVQLVLGYVRDFAELIRDDPKQAQFWRPGMLAMTPGPGRSLSAWDMLVNEVDAWRRRRRDERDAAAGVRARRQRDAEEAEQLERRRMDPSEVARQAAHITGVQPQRDEHEQARRAGRRREADAARTEQDEIETNRKINALFVEFKHAAGRSPAAEEAADIRRRVRGGEGTAT